MMPKELNFFRKLKKGILVSPSNHFEEGYQIGFEFKENFRKAPKDKILDELKRMVSWKPVFHSKVTYEIKRKRIHRVRKGVKCFICKGPAFCQHHIIQLQNGGIDMKLNRIPICNNCHKEIHPWMRKKVKSTPVG